MQLELGRRLGSGSAARDPARPPDVVVLAHRRDAALLVARAIDHPRDVDAAGRGVAVVDAGGEAGLRGVPVGQVVAEAVGRALDYVPGAAGAGVGGVVVGGALGAVAGGRSLRALAVVGCAGDGGGYGYGAGSRGRAGGSARGCRGGGGGRRGCSRRGDGCQASAPDVAVLVGGADAALQVAGASPGDVDTLCVGGTCIDAVGKGRGTADRAEVVVVPVDAALDDKVPNGGRVEFAIVGRAGEGCGG